MELKQRSIGAIAGSFRENADGHAVFYLLDCCKNRLHTSLEIAAVKEQAVQVFIQLESRGIFKNSTLEI